jgi:hypothetical protein
MIPRINANEYGCWNRDCPDFGKTGKGNILIKEIRGKNHRALLKCKTCNKCFCETHGTPFFGLKTPMYEIANTLLLIPELRSIRAVARRTNHKPDSIISWIELVNGNMNEFNEFLHENFNYSQDQIEEIWSYINQRKRVSPNKPIATQKG